MGAGAVMAVWVQCRVLAQAKGGASSSRRANPLRCATSAWFACLPCLPCLQET